MFCAYTEVKAIQFLLKKTRLIFSFYLCLRLTSPNYVFMRCRLYSTQKVIVNMSTPVRSSICTTVSTTLPEIFSKSSRRHVT